MPLPRNKINRRKIKKSGGDKTSNMSYIEKVLSETATNYEIKRKAADSDVSASSGNEQAKTLTTSSSDVSS